MANHQNNRPFGTGDFASVMSDLFAPSAFKWSGRSSPSKEKLPVSSAKLDFNDFGPELIEQALGLYTQGVAITDISALLTIPERDIHNILDRYLPHL